MTKKARYNIRKTVKVLNFEVGEFEW